MRRWVILALLLTGCQTASYLPSLGNVRSFTASDCDMVYSKHTPNNVASIAQTYAMVESLSKTLEKNPTLADKILPSPSGIDALGKAAVPLGNATASIAGAFTDMNPSALMANIIGGVAVQGLQALGNMRSEDKEQDRLDICMPRKMKNLIFVHGDDVLVLTDKDTTPLEQTESVKQAKVLAK